MAINQVVQGQFCQSLEKTIVSLQRPVVQKITFARLMSNVGARLARELVMLIAGMSFVSLLRAGSVSACAL